MSGRGEGRGPGIRRDDREDVGGKVRGVDMSRIPALKAGGNETHCLNFLSFFHDS